MKTHSRIKFQLIILLTLLGCEDKFDIRIETGQILIQEKCRPETEPFGYGTGQEQDPYLLCNPQHFKNISTDSTFANKHFLQTADLDFNDEAIISLPSFEGSYDGNGKRLVNLQNQDGIFLTLASGSVVKNLTIEKATVIGSKTRVGILAGQAASTTLKNITIKDSSIDGGAFDYIAGVIGYATGGVYDFQDILVEDVTVKGGGGVAGIIGYLDSPSWKIERLTFKGTVTGSTSGIGGILGVVFARNTTPLILDSLSAEVSAQGTYSTGGIVGTINRSVHIKNSVSSGEIKCLAGGYLCGGLVGLAQGINGHQMTIENSSSSSNVIGGAQSLGGLVGGASWSAATPPLVYIKNSFATGDVTGTGNNVGGLVGGSNHWGGTCNVAHIENSFASGNVKGANYVGGLVGSNCASIKNSFYSPSHSTINITATANNAGGLVGRNLTAYTAAIAFTPSIENSASFANEISSPGTNKKGVVGLGSGYVVTGAYYFMGAAIPADSQATGLSQTDIEDDVLGTGWALRGFDMSNTWIMPTNASEFPFIHPVHRWYEND